MHVIVMFVTIDAGSLANVGHQNPKRAKSHSHCLLNNNSMNITSASDACLNLHHVYDAARGLHELSRVVLIYYMSGFLQIT